jgi:uncharacterized membrane-anchored protein
MMQSIVASDPHVLQRFQPAFEQARTSHQPLRSLATALATIARGGEQIVDATSIDHEGRLQRQHSLVNAVLVLLTGIVLVLGVIWWLSQSAQP